MALNRSITFIERSKRISQVTSFIKAIYGTEKLYDDFLNNAPTQAV